MPAPERNPFSVLLADSEVQAGEKIRFDGTRTFAPTGITITSMTIKPETGLSAITVWNGTTGDKYLDHIFSFDFRVISSTNTRVNYTLNGVEDSIDITPAVYEDLEAVVAEMIVQLNGEDDPAPWSYSISDTNKVTITHATGTFALLPEHSDDFSALPMLGFSSDSDSEAASQTGARVDYVEKTATLLTTDTQTPTAGTSTVTKTVKVYSAIGDNLFATDSDLLKFEPEIFNYLPAKYSTFNAFHRQAQKLILAHLDKENMLDAFLEKFDRFDFGDIAEVRDWATGIALRLIFEGASNAEDDIHALKAKRYEDGLEKTFRERAVLHLDLDQDGVASETTGEAVDVRTCRVYRR